MTEIETKRLTKLVKEMKPTTEKKPINNIANDCVVWIGDQSACKVKESTPEERIKKLIQTVTDKSVKVSGLSRDINTLASQIVTTMINAGCELRNQGVPKAQRLKRIRELSAEMAAEMADGDRSARKKDKPKKDLTKEEKEWIKSCKRMQTRLVTIQQGRFTELFGSDTDMDMFV